MFMTYLFSSVVVKNVMGGSQSLSVLFRSTTRENASELSSFVMEYVNISYM